MNHLASEGLVKPIIISNTLITTWQVIMSTAHLKDSINSHALRAGSAQISYDTNNFILKCFESPVYIVLLIIGNCKNQSCCFTLMYVGEQNKHQVNLLCSHFPSLETNYAELTC